MTTLKVNRPTEVEIGEYAFVVHLTDSAWRPGILLDNQWYEIDGPNHLFPIDDEEVQQWIDHNEFQIVFEGVK